MQTSPAIETEDKDLPLREDIRLLGRILGDTIREQSGEAVFDTVENIRQNSVRFRRDEDLTARRDLEATLNCLKPKEALQIIRAFGFFLAPRQYRRGSAPHPPDARPLPERRNASRGHDCAFPRPHSSGRHPAGASRRLFCRRHGGAGIDCASDRSAAQKHDRPRDGGGRADRGTRPVFSDRG